MKKLLCMSMVAAVLVFIAPASAEFTIAGGFNGWNSAGNPMAEIESGVWSVTIDGLAAGERSEFKVTDGTWDWSYPGPNSWFYADASGSVTITFNTNYVDDGWGPGQNRLGLSTDPGFWTVAGNFKGDWPMGWDNADPDLAMTPLGGGIYLLSLTLDPGNYEFKPVVTGTWDSISLAERSVGTPNISVTITEDLNVINIYVDALAGTAKMEVVPEPITMLLLGFGSVLAAICRKK